MGTAAQTPILAVWFTSEPSTDPTVIPTRAWGNVGGSDIMRYMRIYFPRSFEHLLEYEFIFMASPDMSFIEPKNQRWLFEALHDHPRGAVNTRSIMSGVGIYYELWRDSILSSAFPNDVDAVIADQRNLQGINGPLVIRDDPGLPSIIKPYKEPVEAMFNSYGGINTVPRQGATILSYTENRQGVGSPVPGQIAHVFYWNWSSSTTFTTRDRPNDAFWGAPVTGGSGSNPYGLDIAVNLIWWSTGRELPRDPIMVHEYRSLVFHYGIQKSIVVSLLEFAEIFGANSAGTYADLSSIDEARAISGSEYLDRDFAAAYATIQVAMRDLRELQDVAVRLKDRVLFWVYLSEWLVTLGVLLISGAVLWSTMVRRSLYRSAASTRFGA